MTESTQPRRRGFFGTTLGALDLTRRIVLNAIFILLVIWIVMLVVRGEPTVRVEEGIAVLFDPAGQVVEEFDADPFERAVNRALLGIDVPQVRLRDLRAALLAAADDARIAALVLDLSRLQPTSLSKIQELAEPLARARANGKRVVVYSDAYDQSLYFLAAHADEVSVHPMGAVIIEGYGSYRLYMREALERLSIDWHVFKAGEYKSYGEPYERDDMSPQVREEMAHLLGALWAMYQGGVEAARGLPAGAVVEYVDGMVDGVRAAGGDLSVYAMSAGLVDQRIDFDSFVERVSGIVGEDDNGLGFRGLGWREYLGSVRRDRQAELARRDRVGLLVASGEIVEGDPGQRFAGAARIAALIEEAREDDRIRALVLRVDSPGGSAFASEQIRAELNRFRDAGKPVVISMSSVAASGGYWISTSADQLWASPATITGSIGAVAMFPTFDRGLARLGVTSDGVGTTRLAGALRPDRPLGDEAAALVQLVIDGVYSDFVERVSDARGMEPAAVDAIGGGRVWNGVDAQRLGLIDHLGGLDQAIAAAAELADLPQYAVSVLERPLGFWERVMMSFFETRAAGPFAKVVAGAQPGALMQVVSRIEAQLGPGIAFSDRRGIYLHCLCEAP